MRSASPWLRARTGPAAALAGMCALLLVAGTMVVSARRPTAMQPGPDVVVRELGTGKLIVASRNLPDPNFRDTVVLLVDYSRDGVAGLVINRPSDVPLSRALSGVEGIAAAGGTAFLGGPVARQAVLALSRTACDSCRRLGRDVYLVNTGDALRERLASGADARQLRVYLGYAAGDRGSSKTKRGRARGTSSKPTRASSSTRIPRRSGGARSVERKACSPRPGGAVRGATPRCAAARRDCATPSLLDIHSSRSARRRNSSGTDDTPRSADP